MEATRTISSLSTTVLQFSQSNKSLPAPPPPGKSSADWSITPDEHEQPALSAPRSKTRYISPAEALKYAAPSPSAKKSKTEGFFMRNSEEATAEVKIRINEEISGWPLDYMDELTTLCGSNPRMVVLYIISQLIPTLPPTNNDRISKYLIDDETNSTSTAFSVLNIFKRRIRKTAIEPKIKDWTLQCQEPESGISVSNAWEAKKRNEYWLMVATSLGAWAVQNKIMNKSGLSLLRAILICATKLPYMTRTESHISLMLTTVRETEEWDPEIRETWQHDRAEILMESLRLQVKLMNQMAGLKVHLPPVLVNDLLQIFARINPARELPILNLLPELREISDFLTTYSIVSERETSAEWFRKSATLSERKALDDAGGFGPYRAMMGAGDVMTPWLATGRIKKVMLMVPGGVVLAPIKEMVLLICGDGMEILQEPEFSVLRTIFSLSPGRHAILHEVSKLSHFVVTTSTKQIITHDNLARVFGVLEENPTDATSLNEVAILKEWIRVWGSVVSVLDVILEPLVR